MDKGLIPFLIAYFITYLVIVSLSRRGELSARGGILVFLIMISFFAPLKVELASRIVVNMSLIFAAAMTSMMTMIAIDHGFKYMMRFALYMVQWLIYIQIMVMCLSSVPQHYFDDGDFKTIANLLNDNTINTFFASYISFILAAAGIAAIVDWCPCRRFYKFILATSSAYVFGGAGFYALAFRHDPDLYRVMAAAVALKILMSVAYYPVIRNMRKDEAPIIL